MSKIITSLIASVSLVCAVGAETVTSGEDLLAAVAAASETEPSVIEIADGDIFLTATLKLTKPITVRGAGIGKTVLRRDASVSSMRMLELGNASALVENLTVTNGYLNSGTGAGAYVSAGTIRRCEFYNCHNQHWNTGWNQGGGVKLSGSNSKLIACVIRGVNVGDGQGEALWLESSAVAESCLICDNTCTTTGRADAYMVKVASATLRGCTIVNNYMGNSVALYNSNGTVKDCIVYGNKGEVATTGGLGKGFDIAGSTGSSSVINTLVTDPGFVDFANKNYALTAGPAIDAALSGEATLALTTVDAAGNPRQDEETGKLDIGCYEFHSSGLTASISSSPAMRDGAASGLTPYPITFTAEADGGEVTAYRWFVNGVEQAAETTATFATNFTVAGTYQVTLKVSDGNQDYDADNTITVKTYPPILYVDKNSTNPVAPYETEATAATFLEDALAAATDNCEIRIAPETYPAKSGEITIGKGVTIRGMGATPADVVLDRKDANTAHRILTISHESSLVTGLTVSGGRRTSQGQYGGGVMITGRGGTISNCVVRNCGANGSDAGGGGIMLDVDNALATHCVVTNCTSSNDAPGNYSYVGGNGVCLWKGTVRDSLIAFCRQNNDSHGRKETWPDGAVAIYGGKMINCTVASNVNTTCSGVRAHGGKLINTIVSCNRLTTQDAAETAKVLAYGKAKTTTFDHCLADLDVDGKFAVEDPAQTFLRPGNGNFRLRAGSKAIDAGDASAVTSTVDLRGNPRILCGAVDLGCYEKKIGLTVLVK